MRSARRNASIVALLAFCLALSFPTAVAADEVDSSIAACLKAWGDHPFGKTPQFKTVGTSLKVFGMGSETADTESTSSPSLVLINPSFNVLGGSSIDLLNPNGWYCLRTAVSILGKTSIRAHCKAQLASTSGGITVRGNNSQNRKIIDIALTMAGTLSVERPCN